MSEMNYQFDLEKWMAMFPLEEPHGHYYGATITGPRHLCNNEWLRRGMQNQYHWGKPIPSDLFVMAEGEPENRFATKIGGLPYQLASASWPASKGGNPLNFVGQINFSDSTDIVGKQPGDLLLIFANNDEGWFQDFYFEWQPIIEHPKLVTNLPNFRNPIAPCYGHRCRVNNFPNAKRKDTRTEYPRCHGKDVWSDFLILQYQGTQIGRAAFQPQPSATAQSPLLCTVSSVQPDLHEAYPWVNREEPLCDEDKWTVDNPYLMIGDLGCIFVRRNWLGRLTVGEQCY